MNESRESLHSISALLVGDEASKKSGILNCVKHHYTQDKLNYTEDRAIFTYQLRLGCSIKLDLCNYRQERTHSSYPFRGFQLYLIVFNYNNLLSLNNINIWLKEISTFTNENNSAVIIGYGFSNANRLVTEDQAKAFAEEQGYTLIQVNEDDFDSIQNAFITAVDSLPSLVPQQAFSKSPQSEAPSVDTTSDPDADSCCRCVLF